MLVWRMEHSESGFGPFQEDVFDEMERLTKRLYGWSHNDGPGRHPTPASDHGFRSYWAFNYCGCRSAGQLRTWFPKEVRKLLKGAGFVTYVYQVDDDYCEVGARQVLFDKGAAELVETLDPVTLLPLAA